MKPAKVVSAAEWNLARGQLLQKEKKLTRELDALAAQRRRLPMTAVTATYRFNTATGSHSLLDLFDGRSQLILYHHMLKPSDEEPCSGCCMFADNVGHLAHLHARDTSFVMVARAPIDEIAAFTDRMQWTLPFVETTDTFNADMGVTDGFGLSVFLRHNDDIYRTYFTSGRGVESLGSTWTFLDLTPLGRQENWEDSPDGWPQSEPYQWWRLHDMYT
jgi:predicted dithiol-disulfide oxidoreductase (DUF899 family)